ADAPELRGRGESTVPGQDPHGVAEGSGVFESEGARVAVPTALIGLGEPKPCRARLEESVVLAADATVHHLDLDLVGAQRAERHVRRDLETVTDLGQDTVAGRLHVADPNGVPGTPHPRLPVGEL